jgi:hypothetical protein
MSLVYVCGASKSSKLTDVHTISTRDVSNITANALRMRAFFKSSEVLKAPMRNSSLLGKWRSSEFWIWLGSSGTITTTPGRNRNLSYAPVGRQRETHHRESEKTSTPHTEDINSCIKIARAPSDMDPPRTICLGLKNSIQPNTFP